MMTTTSQVAGWDMTQLSLDRVLDELPVAVATVAADGTVAYANAAFRRLLPGRGSSLDEVAGVPGTLESLRAGAEAGEVGLEHRFVAEDGSERWGLVSAKQSPDGSLLVVVTDLTERHRREEEHEEQARALRLLAELPERNPGPVGRLTREGTVLMANAAARRFLGVEDVQGRCWMDVCPGMTWDKWDEVLARDPGSDARVLHEAERNGTCVLFTHLRSESGDLVFVYGADITARRQDEQLLAKQAAQLAEVARFPEMNPGPVLRLTREGEVLMANAAARDVFGEELIGRSWTELCPGMDRRVWAEMVDTAGVVPLEARIGERDYVFAHRFDPPTRLMFVFGANVSAQKAAERALRQSEKMATLGTLAAGVAHELNNPAAATRRAADQLRDAFTELEAARLALRSVRVQPEPAILEDLEARAREHAVRTSELGAVERSDLEADLEEWLEDHDVDDSWDLAPPLVAQGLDAEALDPIADQLGDALPATLRWATAAYRVHMLAHEIGQGSARISEIVRALKSYSYLGQAPVQEVDVHEGLDSTLVILRNKLKAGIDVVREYGDDVPRITAYGGELNQVWTNLLDNAVDAMGGTGTIRICTRRDGGWVVVEVVDDGPGIPADVQPRVFDPFFTTKEPGQGTGLGLATSYSIVTEKHHGTLSVTSQPGETRFVVRLPVDGKGEQR